MAHSIHCLRVGTVLSPVFIDLSNITLEIAILLLLFVANGVFATAEMAFVAAKKTRLRKLAVTGDVSAKVAMRMVESPTRFLSTVQVDITQVSFTSRKSEWWKAS